MNCEKLAKILKISKHNNKHFTDKLSHFTNIHINICICKIYQFSFYNNNSVHIISFNKKIACKSTHTQYFCDEIISFTIIKLISQNIALYVYMCIYVLVCVYMLCVFVCKDSRIQRIYSAIKHRLYINYNYNL